MTTRRIRLTRYAAQNVNYTYYGAYRMKVAVTSVMGDDLDKYVFIFKRNAVSPYTGSNCDEFMAVAGPSQMGDVPAGAPDPDKNWPFYRLDSVELDFMSAEQAEQAWVEIQAEVCRLVSAMDDLENLSAISDVWCPSAPDPDSQSSQA
jgi:hypothetical protein